MKALFKVLIIIILLSGSGNLYAQMSTDLIFDNFSTAMTMENTGRDILRFDFPLGKYKKDGSAKKSPAGSKRSLTYSSSAKLREQTVANYAKRVEATNPAMAKAVIGAFGPGANDYGKFYNNVVSNYGLHDNDMIDALTANLVLGYLISNNLQGNNAVSSSQVLAVRRQFLPSISNNTKLTAPGVAAQLGEELKLQFVIQQLAWQSAIKKNNLATFRQKVNSELKTQYGLDMQSVKLTTQGFGPK